MSYRTEILLVIVVLVLGATVSRPSAQEYWPTSGWRTSTPEAQGMDGATLAAFDKELAAGTFGEVSGLVVTRRGHVVFERHYARDHESRFQGARGPYNYFDTEWYPYYKRRNLHTMQSATKSVTSALVGIAIRRKEIPGVDAALLPYVKGFMLPDQDLRRAELTLQHLLTMTTGIKWDESSTAYTDPANNCAVMEQKADWIQYVLDQPMAARPGTTWVYNSGATELLSHVIEKATGRNAADYAAEYLFKPLGITDYYWKRTPKGLADTEGGLYLTARDLAKIGYLYMHDGMWEGRRLLPEGWVAASTSPLQDTGVGTPGRTRKYGYSWWLLATPGRRAPYAWAGIGFGGQRLLVVPELELVAVFTGWNIYKTPAIDSELALNRVLQAVRP